MRLNKIIIKNFGIYKGINEFVFNEKKGENVILIGGKNGSGKTTFLTAIKLAIYGPLIFGYKSINLSYMDFIRDKINIYSLANGEKDASVEIHFEIRNNGVLENYQILREWTINKKKIKESVLIYKNKKNLNEKQIEDFRYFIKRFLPPTLFDFFFFDGEKVNQYVLNRDFENNIKAAFMTLFNLDLFGMLKSDLLKYLKQENVFSNLTNEEKIYTQLTLDLNNQKNSVNSLQERIDYLKEKCKENKLHLEELQKEFTNHGGIVLEEREKLTQEILKMEIEKKQLSESIKDNVTNLLPFFIQKKLFHEVMNQLQNEIEYKEYLIIKDKLSERLIPNIINQLSEKFSIHINEDDAINQFILDLKNKINNQMKPSNLNLETFIPLHQLTNDQMKEIEELYKKVNSINAQETTKKFNRINELYELIYLNRKKLEFSLKDDSLKEIVSKINEKTRLDEQINFEIKGNEEKMIEVIKFQKELEVQLEKSEKRFYQAKKDENIFSLVQKINLIISRYQEIQVKKYLNIVEEYFLEMFNSLMRKGKFLNSFKIDPTTFEMSMLNYNNNPIFKHSLSSGETQLFFLSLLWALLKASKAEVPFILDTLFGRLDHSHKENIIKKYLPVASKQVIILSTDTEIDKRYYEELQHLISQEYIINYDQKTNMVLISDHYFKGEEQ